MSAHRSFSARADIEALLGELDARRLDVPVLQPADPFLDTAGEELRRRIYLTQSETGEGLCLRPEFTIPVCLHHLREDAKPTRYGYVGTVFRQHRQGAAEFLQAGIEDIGASDVAGADARSVGDACRALAALGIDTPNIVLGDQTVFDAVLAALDLPASWRLRLTHAFGSPEAIDAALVELSRPAVMPDLGDDVLSAARSGSEALEQIVDQKLVQAGLSNASGRSASEIASRLMAKIEASRRQPDAEAIEKLRAFLTLRLPLDKATKALEDFTEANSLPIAPALAQFQTRNAAMADRGIDVSAITYDASFGRTLDYYTGLVFEALGPGGEVLAGGGRYDKLLPMLGADGALPGVGFSLWLDRIAACAGEPT